MSACDRIALAPNGRQNQTLNDEAYGIGQLVGGQELPRGVTLQCIYTAAGRMVSYNPRDPWRPAQLKSIIERAFNDGLRSPRRAVA
jgi:hypothetical protein